MYPPSPEIKRQTIETYDELLNLIATTDIFFIKEGCVEIHQQVLKFSKEILLELILEVNEIMDGLRDCGVEEVFTYSSRADRKMKRYWDIMGFQYMGKQEVSGVEYDYALRRL